MSMPMKCAAVLLVVVLPLLPGSSAAQAPVERKVLLQQELTIPGYEALLVDVTLPAGSREGRHTHAATLVAKVLEGDLTLEQEGLPARTYGTNETFSVTPGRVHEGINRGRTTVRLLATFIAEKGKPLTTPVK